MYDLISTIERFSRGGGEVHTHANPAPVVTIIPYLSVVPNEKQKEPAMGYRAHPAEGCVVTLKLMHRRLIQHLRSDGVYDDADRALADGFNAPIIELGRVARIERAADAAIRCGNTRHSRDILADAGLTFLDDYRDAKKRHRECNPDDAA